MIKALGWPVLASGLAALSCGGDNSESTTTEPGLGREPFSCEAVGTLELALEAAVATNLQIPPAAIVHIDDTTFLALDRNGEIFRVGPHAKDLDTPGSVIVSGLGPFQEGAIGFTSRTVFWYRPGSGEWAPLESSIHLTDVRAVISGGKKEPFTWIIDGPEDARRVHLVTIEDVEAPAFSPLDSWYLPGNWRLVTLGSDEAMAISTRSPFKLMKLRRGSPPEFMGALGAIEVSGSQDAGPAVFVSGAVGLDCGAFLVILADLRSDARRLIVVDVKSGAILKRARVDATMSFFASDPSERTLFAYHDTNGGGEVLAYRWTWRGREERKDLDKEEET
jgi:hypothetical protein